MKKLLIAASAAALSLAAPALAHAETSIYTNIGYAGAFLVLSGIACIALAIAVVCLPASPRRQPT